VPAAAKVGLAHREGQGVQIVTIHREHVEGAELHLFIVLAGVERVCVNLRKDRQPRAVWCAATNSNSLGHLGQLPSCRPFESTVGRRHRPNSRRERPRWFPALG
jgi:hypothetical protein